MATVIGRAVIPVTLDTTGLTKGLAAANAQAAAGVTKTGGTIKSLMAGAGVAVAAGLGAAIVGVGVKAVKLEADFSRTMNKVQAATGAPQKSMKGLSDLAIKMGRDTVFSASDASKAMLELAKGGMTPATIQAGALKATMALASAGELDMATSANTVVKAMGAFGLTGRDAGQVANALAGAANASSADVGDLSYALSAGGLAAKTAGFSIQETTAILAGFANQGLIGSDAGTSLKTMLDRLVPTTERARGAMEQLGIITEDGRNKFLKANGDYKSASEIAGVLSKAMEGLSESEKKAALSAIFGSDAQRGATALANLGAEGVKKLTKATSDQAAAQKMADAGMKGTAGALEQLAGSWETLLLQIGIAIKPMVTAGLKMLTGAVNGLGAVAGFLGQHTGVVKAFTVAIAALGTVMAAQKFAGVVSAAGGLASWIGQLKVARVAVAAYRAAMLPVIAAQKAWAAAQWLSNTANLKSVAATVANTAALIAHKAVTLAIAAATKVWAAVQWVLNAALSANPIGIIVMAVAALVAAFVWAWKNVDGFREGVLKAWEAIKNGIKAAVEWVVNVVKTIWGGIVNVVTTVWNAVKNAVVTVVTNVINWVKQNWGLLVGIILGPVGIVVALVIKYWDQIKAALTTVWNAIKTTAATVWGGIRDFFTGIWNGIKTAATTVWNAVRNVIVTIWNGIRTAATTVWNAIKTAVLTVWNWFKTGAQVYFNAVRTVITTVWNAIRTVTQTVWNAIRTVLTTVWNGIKTVVQTAINVVRTVVTNVWNTIRNVTSTVWNAIRTLLTTIWNNVRAGATTIFNAIRTLVTNIWNTIRTTTQTVWNAIRSFLSGLWDGIKNLVSNAINSVRNTITNVWNTINTTTRNLWNGLRDFFSSLWERIKSGVSSFVSGFERLWNGIKEAARKPVSFIVNTVWNNGIRKVLNLIPGVNIGAVGGWKEGGAVYGGKPNKDSVPALLMGGEHVLTKAEVKLLGGQKRVYELRDAIRSGRITAKQMLNEMGDAYLPYRPASRGIRRQLFALGGAAVARGRAFAQAQAGKPYVWGGEGPGGWDCSGLQSGITNRIRGGGGYGVRLGTTNTMPWAGFVAGSSSEYTIGNNRPAGHMAGTVGGLNAEATPPRVRVGGGARGGGYGTSYRMTNAQPGPTGGGGAVIPAWVAGAVKAVKTLVSSVGGWISNLRATEWGKLFARMVSMGVEKARDWLVGKLREFVPDIGDIVKGIGGAISNAAQAVWNFFTGDTGGIVQSGSGFVNRSGRPERILDPQTTRNFDTFVGVLDAYMTPAAYRGARVMANGSMAAGHDPRTGQDLGMTDLLAEVASLREDIRRLPRDYRMGERQGGRR